MNKYVLLICMLFIGMATHAQKISIKNNGQPIDRKLSSALKFTYQVVESESPDYIIEVLFTGSYSLGRGYKGFYIVSDNTGKELYRSEVWKSGGYGAAAENYIVRKIEKDLKKYLNKK